MKALYWVIGILLAVPILVMGVTYGASELGGEVVTLHRIEANGEVSQVRIWIVDQNDLSWIEHGDADSHYINVLAESPNVVLTRKGQTNTYVGTPDRNSHELYHKLRLEKYSWADQVIELIAGSSAECEGVPVRLKLSG